MSNIEWQHPTFEQINDLVDGRLGAEESRAIETHIAICDVCAAQHARLGALLDAAHRLPESIDPPSGLWKGVRAGIGGKARVAVSRRPWQLAAAAVLLVAFSSGITALLVRRPQVIFVRHEEPSVATVRLSAPARSVDADYAAVIRELDATLAQRRAQLDPRTIAKVEASLRVIDDAIDEARHALAADPANLDLLDLLAASYERKLELLRRANDLPPST